MEDVKRRWTRELIVINESEKCTTIQELRDAINNAVLELDKKHPEWRSKDTYWFAERDLYDDYDDNENCTSSISLHFSRYMTEDEEKKADLVRHEAKQRAVTSMKELIRRNYDDALEFMEELKTEHEEELKTEHECIE